MTDGRPPRADARRNRARILEAAHAVFSSRGVSAPTEDIARTAGVGIGTVFRHFPTKEALIEAVILIRLERLREQGELLAGADDPGAAFFEFLSSVVDSSRTKLTLVDALGPADAVAALSDTPEGQDRRRLVDRILRRAQRAGAVRADVGVNEVIGLMVGCSRAAQYAGHDQRAVQRMLSVVYDGLRAHR